ncbi:MAG: endonuclease III [Oscillospiraceae bacterium]|nr:endonuclease III [Oscillospiraceae bacterium]
MRTKEQVAGIVAALEKEYPLAECTLEERDPWKLLVQVRLAAQCTDARVNQVTPALFERYPTVYEMAEAEIEDVEGYIRSTGFYHGKARDIVAAAQMLVSEYNGKVPDNMEDLLRLPGVGRKSANLILGDVYGVPGSVVVDTHCIRLTGRLGYHELKDPAKIETVLRDILPPEKANDFCHRLVMHGRAVCDARKPACENCCLRDLCRYYSIGR